MFHSNWMKLFFTCGISPVPHRRKFNIRVVYIQNAVYVVPLQCRVLPTMIFSAHIDGIRMFFRFWWGDFLCALFMLFFTCGNQPFVYVRAPTGKTTATSASAYEEHCYMCCWFPISKRPSTRRTWRMLLGENLRMVFSCDADVETNDRLNKSVCESNYFSS